MKFSNSLCLVGLLCIAASAQAEIDSTVKEATAMMLAGQPDAAFDRLAPQEAPRAGDTDFDLALGLAANQAHKFSRAIFALERVLLVQPNNAQAATELARALFAVGKGDEARAMLTRARADGAPVEVGTSLDHFLQALDKVDTRGRSSFKAFVEGGLGSDDNVNSAPNDSSVSVPAYGGTVVPLNADGIKTSASFAVLRGGVSNRYALNPQWSLFGKLGAALRANDGSANQFDTKNYAGLGGAAYRHEKNEFSLGLRVATDDLYSNSFRQQSGVLGEWIYRLDGFRQFGTFVQLGDVRYSSQSARDAKRQVLGTTYAQIFPSGLTAYGGVYLGTERTFDPLANALGHNLSGLRIGVQKRWSTAVSVFANAGYEQRTFSGDDALFQVTRGDQQSTLDLGLSWIPAPLWRITPQLSLVHTQSNIAINQFDKNSVSVIARRDF